MFANGLLSRKDAPRNNVALSLALENGWLKIHANTKVNLNARKSLSITATQQKPRLDVVKRLAVPLDVKALSFARSNAILMGNLFADPIVFTNVLPSRSMQIVTGEDAVPTFNTTILLGEFLVSGLLARFAEL